MLIKIWDYLFTRKIWTTVEICNLVCPDTHDVIGKVIYQKDQFGNIRRKKLR